jgi:hypothetical protein
MTTAFGVDATGKDILGHIVWYECSTSDSSYTEVEAIVAKHGLDADTFPKANRKKAYHHAVGAYQSEHDRVTVDKLPANIDAFRHQITQMIEVKESERQIWNFTAEVTTSFTKSDERVTVEAIGTSVVTRTVKAKIEKHINTYMDHVHVDVVRDWIGAELARANAISARKAGGLWFVPASQTTMVEAIENVLAEIGSTLLKHPVLDTDEWRTNAASFAEDDLVGDFTTMKADLDALVDEAKATGEIKKFKLETLLGRFTKLEAKEGLYEDLLAAKLGDLQKGIASVKKQIGFLALGKVAGIEPVETAHLVREKKRTAQRTKVAKEKAAKTKAQKDAEAKKAAAQKALAEKLAPVKKAKKAERSRKAKKQIVRQSKKADTPF